MNIQSKLKNFIIIISIVRLYPKEESIQNNLDNFDKDIQKEKDNSRSM